jgi:hypothetical protein
MPHIMKGFSLENLEGDAVHVGYHYIEDENGVVKEVVAANKSGTDDFTSHQFKPEDTTADVIKIKMIKQIIIIIIMTAVIYRQT